MTEKIQLSNGLKVLFHESHKSPVISVQMWVRTGSADEKKAEEGISHFIEHLVFKGTRKYKVGEIASTVEASGGELNAYTSFDQTVFYVTISKQFADVALDVVSEMMGFPTFDSTEIDNEREVVIEEIKRTFDNPGRQASRMLFSTVYQKHPYGIPVIGYEKNIKKVSKETLVNYFQSRYVPDNMYLVVVGDFSRSAMQKKVEDKFGAFERHQLRSVTRPIEPEQKGTRVEAQKAKFEEAMLNFAWRGPKATHPDVPALDLLAMILGQGESSRLNRRLRIEKPLVNYVGAYTYTPSDEGFFSISAGFNGDNLDEVLGALGEEILLLLAEPPSQDELDRAIVNLESEEFYSMETVDGLSQKVGHYEFLFEDPDYHQKFMEQIRTTKPEDLLRVARTYLNPRLFTATVMAPKNEAKARKKLQDWTAQLDFGLEVVGGLPIELPKKGPAPKLFKVAAAREIETKTVRHELKSGATLLVRPNFQTPTISVRSAFLGGVRSEPKGLEGLTELLSSVWTSGTENLSEQEIMLSTERIAAHMRAFGGRNTVGLNMDLLAPFAKEALALFSEVLTKPLLAQPIIDREKVVMLEQIKSKYDNPSSVAIQNFMERLFGEHPYGRDDGGTNESVAKISRAHLTDHFNAMVSRNNLTICVTGAIETEAAIDFFENATGQLKPGKKLSQGFTFKPPVSDQSLFHKLDREQSHLVIGYPGLTFADKDRHSLQVIQSVLAGQGGRLFLNLRDKASLAYSVSPLRMEGIDAGYFGAYIGCSPEKVDTALKMLLQEFDVLVQEKVGAVELERSKAYLIGRHDIALQKNSSIASSILFDDVYGLHFDETFKFSERIKAVTSDDIQRVSKKIFAQPYVVSLVGPKPLKKV